MKEKHFIYILGVAIIITSYDVATQEDGCYSHALTTPYEIAFDLIFRYGSLVTLYSVFFLARWLLKRIYADYKDKSTRK